MENTMHIVSYIIEILGALGIIVEITPQIKFSPLDWLGKRLNKSTNDRIDAIEKKVNNMEYNEDMKELRTIMNRIHAYGMMIRKGEEIPYDTLISATHDIDKYYDYKEQYHYQIINGEKVPINGGIEIDKNLILEALKNSKGN